MKAPAEQAGMYRRLLWIALSFCVAKLFALWLGRGLLDPQTMATQDPDSWLRLYLVRQLAEGGGWFNHTVLRLDPPLGVQSPWTRPVDLLLLFFSAPMIPWLGLTKALPYAAIIYSQGLLIGCCFLLLRISCMLAYPVAGAMGMLLFFLTTPSVLDYFSLANADHHALLIFLSVVALWCACRWSEERRTSSLVHLALILGLGGWVSVEFFLFAAVMISWVGVQWLRGQVTNAQWAAMSACFAATLILGWLLEHPQAERWSAFYDTVSWPYVLQGIGFMMATLVICLLCPPHSSWRRRAALSFIFYGAVLAATLTSYPLLLQGPEAQTSEFMRQHLLRNVREMKPLYDSQICLALLLICMWGIGVWSATTNWRRAEKCQPFLILLMLLGSLFLALSMLHLRLYYYALPSAVLLFGFWLGPWLDARRWREFNRYTMAIIAGSLPLFAVMADMWFFAPYHLAEFGCNRDILQHLQDHETAIPAAVDGDVWVLPPDIGPQALYVSGISIFASNYHRNTQGYEDFVHLATASDDQSAMEILRKHEVKYIALCKVWTRDHAFFERLFDDALRPAGIERVKNASPDPAKLQIFQVQNSALQTLERLP